MLLPRLHHRLLHPRIGNVVGYCKAQRNTTDILREVGVSVGLDCEGIEDPMHAQENPAEAVLYDHLPQATIKLAYVSGPYRSLVVFVDTIEFLGHERGVAKQSVGFFVLIRYAIKPSRAVERCGPEGGVPGGVSREGGRKVLVGVLARSVRKRCTQRQPIRLTIIIDRVIAHCCWTHGGVVLTNAYHRSPEVVDVFLFPRKDASITHRNVHQSEQSGVLFWGVSFCIGNLTHDLVVQARWRTQLSGSVISPIDAYASLVNFTALGV